MNLVSNISVYALLAVVFFTAVKAWHFMRYAKTDNYLSWLYFNAIEINDSATPKHAKAKKNQNTFTAVIITLLFICVSFTWLL